MILEARQFAESDRKMKGLVELKNSINGQVSSVSRSYSEFGWLLDSAEQEMVKETIQKARGLPPDEDNYILFKELLAAMEKHAARLADMMFSTPGTRSRSAAGAESESEPVMQQLLISALDDLQPQKP